MVGKLFSLYSWRYPLNLVALWRLHSYRHTSYLKSYWTTNDFAIIKNYQDLPFTSRQFTLVAALAAGMTLQVVAGVVLLALSLRNDIVGGWQFGLALILAYPLVWAHLLPLMVLGSWLTRPKALGRAILCRMLEKQVRRLRKKHHFKLVVVAGSVGKTSTKLAIAQVLQVSRQVRWQEGNYNDRVTVPLVFFDLMEPNIFNVPAWFVILLKNELVIRRPYPYQVVVAELGTDKPGEIALFDYLQPDLVVITAITAEHMERFVTLEAVADEELTTLRFSERALINTDDTPSEFLKGRKFLSYGLQGKPSYQITTRDDQGLGGQRLRFRLAPKRSITITTPLLGEQGAKIVLAAVATAHILELDVADIEKGAVAVSAFAGRMQILHGIKASILIDDTYNASPVAAKAALDVLQSGEAPQRIAILGAMNELGDYSPQAHREVGEHCDPSKLDLVVTVGSDANTYLAPVAKQRGCHVQTCVSPYEAGRYVKKHLKKGAVVLAKGSQNRVFAEEALKVLLANPEDEARLVRQSKRWMAVKGKQFTP